MKINDNQRLDKRRIRSARYAAMAFGSIGTAIPAATSLNAANKSPAPRMEAASWRFDGHRRVATISTRYAPIVYFVPAKPTRVLVLAFGYPWDEASDATIFSYAQANVRDWTSKYSRRSLSVML